MKRRHRHILLAMVIALPAAPVPCAGPVAAGVTPQASLSDLLDIPAPPEAVRPARDPFQPSVAAPSFSPPPPEKSQAEALLETLRVTAILRGSGRATAVINGHIVRQGDTLQGLKILKITKNEVWLEVEGKKVSLMFKENLYTPPPGEGE